MKCPKCGKEHTGKFKHCQHCLDKFKQNHILYREKHKKNKPTNCIICGKIIEQSRMGRPKIYCTECAFKQYRNWKKGGNLWQKQLTALLLTILGISFAGKTMFF